MTVTQDIAIAGAGFCGLMTLYHMVAQARGPLRIAIVDPEAFGRGLAYTTTNVHHLLNVRAKGMSALPEQPAHFLDWLNGDKGREQAQALGLAAATTWQPDDFAPRALYARYLLCLRDEALAMAAAKKIDVTYHQAEVEDIARTGASYELRLSGGASLRATRVLLALGNLPQDLKDAHPRHVARVWDFDFAQLAGEEAPVAIIGTGLTMVDIVIALRDAGYKGKIAAISRNGWLPMTHDMQDGQYDSAAAQWATTPQRLRRLFAAMRQEVRKLRASGMSWQIAFDHWRPSLPALWGQLSAADRREFLRRYFTLWGIHRHRMAPQIGRRVQAELDSGMLELCRGGAQVDKDLRVTCNGVAQDFKWVFDCRGPGYDIRRAGNALLRKMTESGLLSPDATGWGVAVEDDLRVAGQSGLYAIGPLAIGARLETTAVPELRQQAQALAAALLESESRQAVL